MTAAEILEMLVADDKGAEDNAAEEALFQTAATARSLNVGDCVHLRGLIEFSNHCRKDCLYCGLRRSNAGLPRYRMTPVEIVAAALEGATMGLGTIVLQSGEDLWYTPGIVADIISSIKERADVAITLSLGERERDEYALWKQAGADRYLLKHETSDGDLYWSMKPGCRLADRLRRLEWLRGFGYEVGSGIIVGLPGQVIESIVHDIIFLRDFGVHMASAGPFIPHEGTPLGRCGPGSARLALRITACMRLALPWANIPATSALGTLDGEAQAVALSCGANVLMPNVTPTQYRRMYEIYPDKVGSLETPALSVARCRGIAQSVGLAIGMGRGGCAKRDVHRASSLARCP